MKEFKSFFKEVGGDVEVFIRDKDGIHQPQIVIEQTPNELPVDKIVTMQ